MYLSKSRKSETAKVNTQVNVFNVHQKVEGQGHPSPISIFGIRFNVYQKVEGQEPSISNIETTGDVSSLALWYYILVIDCWNIIIMRFDLVLVFDGDGLLIIVT